MHLVKNLSYKCTFLTRSVIYPNGSMTKTGRGNKFHSMITKIHPLTNTQLGQQPSGHEVKRGDGGWLKRNQVLLHYDAKFMVTISFLSCVMTSYLVTIFSNIASALSPPNTDFPILPDLGLSAVPPLRILWLTDLFVQTPTIYTLLYIFLLDPQPIISLARIWQTVSIAYILRSISMVVTSLPDPRPGCLRVTTNFLTTFTLHRCGGTQ